MADNERDTYINSCKTRPREVTKGGSGVYCCVPMCGSATYDQSNNKSGIGFFTFPKDGELRRKWKSSIGRYRRKGGSDTFQIKDTTVVCEFHFRPEEIKVSLGVGRKTLIKGSVPSIFKFSKSSGSTKIRKPPMERFSECASKDNEFEGEAECQSPDNSESVPTANCEDVIEDCSKRQRNDREAMEDEIQNLRLQLEASRLECVNTTAQLEAIKRRAYCYDNISKDPYIFKKATGLDVDCFKELFSFLNSGDQCENIKLYEPSKQQEVDRRGSCQQKPGPKPKLSAMEQLFLVLVWLKNGFALSHLSWLFDTPKSTVSRYIITWTNFLYFSLGRIPIWPSREKISETMPESFLKTYPSTRCILDCTELFCQRPSSLRIQSSLYSSYKHHVTYKGLIGIAPSGAIIFISQLFDGSISDREIVARSGILNPSLWSENDSVMADRGFTIAEDLQPLKVKLNIPAFLNGREQLSENEVKESQTIASVRIHVERAIQRVKTFKILRNEIPLCLHGSINQIWTVACLLCNFLPPLVREDSSSE